MDKDLSGPELRKLVQEMMRKFKIVQEDDDDDDDLGIYGGGFDPYEFGGEAMRAAKADIEASGEKFEPLGASKFEKGMDPEELKADLMRTNLNLPKEKEVNKQIQQNLDKRYKHEKQFGVGSLNESTILEFEEDPYEGPQPGDVEYHTNKPNIQKGLGEFKHIDWQMLHEIFAANTEFHNTGKVEGNPKYMEAGINDLLDDGFLSPEELDLLENREIIEIVGHYPVFSNDAYMDYNTFLHAAKEAWEKGFDNSGLNQNHNIEAPYMRGRELDENMIFDTTNLYKFLKDVLHYAESNGLNYAETAELLENTLNEHFEISKKMSEGFVNPESKINRPKDAKGEPLTIRTRVKDLETGATGHVKQFGIDDNGKQTVLVDWIQAFGEAVPKTITYPNKIVVDDETRVVREDEIEEGMGHSHTMGRGQNVKPGNYPQTLKRVGLKENLDNAVSADKDIYLVVDDAFNRAHYKDLIGKTFADAPPGYARVKVVKPEDVEKEKMVNYDMDEDLDYASAEREHHGQQELNALSAEAEQQVPEELIQFMVPGSFNMTDADEDGRYEMSFILKVPKQSDETVKDLERFIKEYLPTDIGGPGQSYQKTSLYTELEKMTNKWIVDVNVARGYDI